MAKRKKQQRQEQELCGCCGARMEVAEELAPEIPRRNGEAAYCENCGPNPKKTPYCTQCDHLR